MLLFKKDIMSQVVKRQEQQKIMDELDRIIEETEQEYEEELNRNYDIEDKEENSNYRLRHDLDNNINGLAGKVSIFRENIDGLEQFY